MLGGIDRLFLFDLEFRFFVFIWLSCELCGFNFGVGFEYEDGMVSGVVVGVLFWKK